MDQDGIYNENGNALEFANIVGNINTSFTHSQDTLSIYVFVKNKGDRYIIPEVSLTYNQSYLSATQIAYYFDVSAGNIDPISLKSSGSTASSVIDSVNSATKNEFPQNSYIDNLDIYMLKIVFSITGASGDSFNADFDLNISFMADVQY
ncbi:MAG: hypothetical protein IKC79_01425, partial [Clostridia bacterium]|nr:hypothetical protein [Clostridia bacterium]